MKYIRTKDGIIDTSIWEYDKYNKCWFNDRYKIVGGEYHRLIYKEDIITQADTIEELCDTFVVWEGKKLITFITYTNVQMPRFKEMSKKHIFTIYGAIWTDKGLVYVAKMNEKGELELL